MNGRLFLLLLLGLVALAGLPTAHSAPQWKTIVEWREPLDKAERKANAEAIQEHVKAMVKVTADPKQAVFQYKAGPDEVPVLEGYALSALAVMNALPYLAKDGAAPDETLFNCAKEAARKAMSSVLRKALPEYWAQVQKPPVPSPAPSAALTIKGTQIIEENGKKETLPALFYKRAYGIPVLLMVLEQYFAGALEYSFQGNRFDRPARGTFLLEEAAQLGIARLTALLLNRGLTEDETKQGKADEFDGNGAKLEPHALWEYRVLGVSTAETCLHKSGFVMMGLRAAFSMGLASFHEKAFAFSWKVGEDTIGMKRFFHRLSDVLIHVIHGVMDIKADGPNEQLIGVLGFKDYVRLQPKRAGLPHVQATDRAVNLSHYRTLHATKIADGHITRIYAVEYDQNAPAWPASIPLEVAYRYKPSGFGYGTYHTASAAYVLLTAANALPLLLGRKDLPLDDMKKQYPIQAKIMKDGSKVWSVKVGNDAFDLSLDPKTGPYTRLKVTALNAPNNVRMDINQRVTQCLNFVVRLSAKLQAADTKGERELDKEPVKDAIKTKEVEGQHWETTLAGNAKHADIHHAVCCFGLVKLGIAAGCPDTFGPWPYYRDLCTVLRDSKFLTPNNTHAHREFLLLILTRGYRPLFGRDSAQD